MAHTFDIRFDRSAGLLGLFTIPANSFRWKGAGTLHIDASGISFAMKRGLLSLFPRTRRLAAASLREVYREGEALHLTFETTGAPRATVSCWAADANTAAEIVGLLPTRRTLEIEHATDLHKAVRPHYDRRLLAGLAALAVGITAGWLLLRPGNEVVPAVTLVQVPNIPVDVTLTAPQLIIDAEDLILPIAPGTANFEVASRQLQSFETDAQALLDDYRVDRKLLESGAMDSETFANRLGGLELRWWNVTYRILDDGAFGNIELLDIRATLMAAARHWRAFLAQHAEGIRKGDHVMIARSFDELARAEQLQSRARLFVRQAGDGG